MATLNPTSINLSKQHRAAIRRRTAIFYILSSKDEWVTASSLSTRFGVSKRAIYRDMNELINIQLKPILSVAGKGYRRFYLFKGALTCTQIL